jgi:hypothetical protein
MIALGLICALVLILTFLELWILLEIWGHHTGEIWGQAGMTGAGNSFETSWFGFQLRRSFIPTCRDG